MMNDKIKPIIIFLAVIIVIFTIFSIDVPDEVEYEMVGERWNVGEIKHGIELTGVSQTGIFSLDTTTYFGSNGTTYSYAGKSTVIIDGVKFTIDLVRAESGYIRVRW